MPITIVILWLYKVIIPIACNEPIDVFVVAETTATTTDRLLKQALHASQKYFLRIWDLWVHEIY